MKYQRCTTIEDLKEKVLSFPTSRLTPSERARCMKEEKIKIMSNRELEELVDENTRKWVKYCDRIKIAIDRKKIYDMQPMLLRAAYNIENIQRELNRREEVTRTNAEIVERLITKRQVQANDQSQLLAPPTASSVQAAPSLEELDSFDLETVSFEDLLRDANSVSSDQQEAPTDNIEPLPLSFNPDELPDLTPEELDCLF